MTHAETSTIATARSHRVAFLALLGALGMGCQDSDTAALIEIKSDMGQEVTKVVVELRDTDDRLAGEAFSFDATAQRKFRVPFSFRVVRERGKPQFVVRATAYRQDTFLAQAKLRISLVAGETSHHDLWLLAACRDVQCDDGASCDPEQGACGAIPRSSVAFGAGSRAAGGGGASGMESDDGSEVDAGDDASPMDAGSALDGATAGGGGATAGGGGATAGGGGATAGGGGDSAAEGGRGGSASGAGASGDATGAGGNAGGAAGAAGMFAAGSGGGPTGEPGGMVLDMYNEKAHVTYQGRDYIVANYVYDPDAEQSLSYNATNFTVTRVKGESAAGIALPSVYIGSVWYEATTGSNLPKLVSSIRSIDVTFKHNAGTVAGVYNALHALWFTTDGDPDTGMPNGGYLEVWYYAAPDFLPSGTLTARQLTIAGVPGQWDVYQATCNERPCIVYLSTQAISSFQGDLKPFLDDAQRRQGSIQSSWYVTNVITGFDLRSGGIGLRASEISSIVR